MTHFEKLIFTLAIIFVSLGLGCWFRHWALLKVPRLGGQCLDRLRKRLQTIAIFALIPVSAMLSLWGLPKPEPGLLALPVLGIVSYVLGGMLALLAARLLKLSRAQTGSLYCCGTFTNIGAVGGLVCLLFLGENSIALVALYRLLEEVYYFSVSFPIARWYGSAKASHGLSFRDFKFNPTLGAILLALGLGIALNLTGVRRPEFLGIAASGCLMLATVFFLFAIGLSLRPSRLFCHAPASAAICCIKFLCVPLTVTALAKAVGYGDFEGALPLKVVATLSSMPVAMTALVPPSLFDLDVDLANACWIFSTLGLVLVLPALTFILPAL